MGYLSWHYQQGLNFLFKKIAFWYKSIWYYFSPTLLLKTLFWPWKKLSDNKDVGMNFSRLFEKITFNLISSGMGFTVRLILIIFFVISFIFLIPISFLTIVIWLIFPFTDIRDYLLEKKREENELEDIKNHAIDKPKILGQYLKQTNLGQFFNKRIPGIDKVFLKLELNHPEKINDENTSKFIESILIDSNLNELLNENNISIENLKLTARWFDKNQQNLDTNQKQKQQLNRSSIASELIFGYTNFLKTYVDDMSLKQKFSEHLVGREGVVKRIETVLLTGKSVLLRGDEGVGKMSVIYEFAARAVTGQLDKSFLYHRVLSLNYEIALSETSDSDHKKTILTKLISEAEAAGNVILVLRNFDQLVSGNYNYADVLIKAIDREKVKIIGICNNKEFNETFVNDSQILTYFEPIEVLPPSQENVEYILAQQIEEIERKSKVTITTSALRQIIDGSEQYITEIPFPEKAIELLDEVVINNKGKLIDYDQVNQVISQKTGIIITKLNQLEKEKLANLEEIIHQNLINQKAAVSLIGKSLRARSVQIKSSERPVGSFLFLGPTGVGKTQTAKVLADTYFGDRDKIIRFDMAEYSGSDGINRLIGFPGGQPSGQLTTKIKEDPSSLLLLDEFEKANTNIFNLFLTLLDEGYISDIEGNKIICKYLFVIATSNAASEYIRQQVEKGVKGEELQSLVVEYVQQNKIFSPEFLNRFDGVVVFEPLNQDQLVEVAKLQLKDLKENLIKNNNIEIEFDESVAPKIVKESYDINFGARPMRRTIDLIIADIIGKEIIEGKIIPGNKIKLIADSKKDIYLVKKI